MDFRGIKEFIKDAFKYILVIVIVLFISIYVITLQQVVGPSMNPTYSNGDVLILDKLHYHLFNIKRDDIISFEYDDTKYLIKRVIGLPGETISYKDNVLYVNGKSTDEDFTNILTDDFDLSSLGYDTIPDDMYLVLGDNRQDSMDSREIGLISKDDIIGKVVIRIWPLFN